AGDGVDVDRPALVRDHLHRRRRRVALAVLVGEREPDRVGPGVVVDVGGVPALELVVLAARVAEVPLPAGGEVVAAVERRRQGVVAGAAEQRVVAVVGAEPVVAVAAVELVAAGVADERVVARPAEDRVVAGAAVGVVVAGAAVEGVVADVAAEGVVAVAAGRL